MAPLTARSRGWVRGANCERKSQVLGRSGAFSWPRWKASLPRISAMPFDSPTLLVAAAVGVFVATAGSATSVAPQRVRRLARAWIAANVLLGTALLLYASAERLPVLLPLAALLVLQWPVLVAVSMRHFFSRGGGGVPGWADPVVLVAAFAVVFGVSTEWLAGLGLAQAVAASMIVATAYAALVVSRLDDAAASPVLKAMRAGLLCCALLQAAWFAIASVYIAEVGGFDFLLAALLAPAVMAVFVSQLWLVMNHERKIGQLRATHRKLRRRMELDTLTGLPNLAHFHELAGRAVAAAAQTATLLVFGVGGLPRINELLGTTMRDEALRQVGVALRETLRRRDVAGRVDTDVFAALLPRTSAADAGVAVTRLRARVDDRQVAPRLARIDLEVNTTQMSEGEPIADALRRAQAALAASRLDAQRREEAAAADGADTAAQRASRSTGQAEHSASASNTSSGPTATA